MSRKMKNILSLISLVVMIFLAVGSTDTDESSSNSSSTTSSYNSSSSVNSTPEAIQHWYSHAYITDLEKEKEAYVASNKVKPDSKMDFSYTGTTAQIIIAKNKNKTWAYIKFSNTPNIINEETEDGYNVIKANVYIDDVRETATLTQEWSSKLLFFMYPTWLINKLKTCSTFRINLRWYNNLDVVWSFSGEGFTTKYQLIQEQFNNL